MSAFTELFEPLRPGLFRVALRLVGPDEAEDVVMETYLKAWQSLPKFREGSKLKTWLYRIAYNSSIDVIRQRGRRKETSISQHEDGEAAVRDIPDTNQPGPDELVEKNELVATVRTALERLPEPHRVALQLRYTDGLSYLEIAAATNVSMGTVMSRLFNGKRKLRQILEAEAAQ